MQHIKDIMTPNPETCRMNHSISCALKIMKNVNCGAVPIVDENNRVQSIITDRDIALCMLDKSEPPDNVMIQDCIRTRVGQVITVKPDDEVHHAIELMEQHQVRRLPVVDEQGHCVGIVAQADVARKDENKKEVAEMLETISEPAGMGR